MVAQTLITLGATLLLIAAVALGIIWGMIIVINRTDEEEKRRQRRQR